MTLEELKTILESTGLPVTYRAWPEDPNNPPPPMPYICYLSPYDNNMAADGIVWHTAHHVVVELYTELLEPDTEKKITDALTAAGIYWTRDEEYIAEERCYQIIFESEV